MTFLGVINLKLFRIILKEKHSLVTGYLFSKHSAIYYVQKRIFEKKKYSVTKTIQSTGYILCSPSSYTFYRKKSILLIFALTCYIIQSLNLDHKVNSTKITCKNDLSFFIFFKKISDDAEF